MLFAVERNEPGPERRPRAALAGDRRWRRAGRFWLRDVDARRPEPAFPACHARLRDGPETRLDVLGIGRMETGAEPNADGGDATTASRMGEEFLRRGGSALAGRSGAFAFIVADRRAGTLYLGRDPFGFVPLFFREDDAAVLVSTCLRELLGVLPAPEIDRIGVLRYFLFRYVVAPNTLFEGVRQVPPGTCVALDGGAGVPLEERRSPRPDRHRRPGQAEHEVRESLSHAVRRHSEDCESTAVAFSGGIDSAILTVLAARHAGDRRRPTAALRLRPAAGNTRPDVGSGLSAAWRERHRVALSTFDFHPRDFALLPRFLEMLGEPMCIFPSFYLFLLLSKIGGAYERLLLGEGSDELFLGYRHQLGLLRAFVRSRLEAGAGAPLSRADLLRWRAGKLAPTLGWRPPEEDVEAALACLPAEQVGGDLDDFVDSLVTQELSCFAYFFPGVRLGAAFGLEVRCPFLDPGVVACARSLSWELLVPERSASGLAKPVLRRAFADSIPATLRARPKRGFGEGWTLFEPLLPRLSRLGDSAMARLRASGLPVGHVSPAASVRRDAEARDLLWHAVFLGAWLDPDEGMGSFAP